MGKLKSLLTGLTLGALIGALMDPERRRKAKAILEELRGIVKTRARTLSDVSKESYDKLVDAAVSEYHQMKGLSEDEVGRVKTELKGAWEDVKTSLKK